MAINPTKLRYGPYRVPPFRLGQKVECLARGEVTICRISNGRISWPMGKKGSAISLVLYADLARAVEREAASAIQFWWGVSGSVTWHWRRALGFKITDGDRAVRREYMTPKHNRTMTRAAAAVARSPARRKEIAAAKRGVKRPRAVIEKIRRANLGKSITKEVRQKMSESHKRRGTRPPAAGIPWSEYETSLLTEFSPANVARRTGRTMRAVYAARKRLKELPKPFK
jgi:hypothetical protein